MQIYALSSVKNLHLKLRLSKKNDNYEVWCLMSISDGYLCVHYWEGAGQQHEVDGNC